MSMSVNQASAVLRGAMRDTIRRRSWIYIFQGGVMCLAGALALVYPLLAGTGLVATLGGVLILSAAVQAGSFWGTTSLPHFSLQLVSVAIEFLVGFLLVFRPEVGLVAITLLLLVLFLVGGLTRVIFALMVRPMQDWIWLLASGIAGIACAMLLLLQLPEASTWFLGMLLGIHLASGGAAMAWTAWRIGSAGV